MLLVHSTSVRRSKPARCSEMKKSHREGVATRSDPESCVGVRKDEGEALTGERVGRVLSREMNEPGAQTLGTPGCQRRGGERKATSGASISRDALGPRAVRDPAHARNHLAREPGDPTSALEPHGATPHREV